MTETVKRCYCDVLSEHNGQKVSGASTYTDIEIMIPDVNDSSVLKLRKTTLDMCPDCYQKYRTNLKLTYDYLKRPVYEFINTSSNS